MPQYTANLGTHPDFKAYLGITFKLVASTITDVTITSHVILRCVLLKERNFFKRRLKILFPQEG